jgi:hypothetical protein
MMVHHQGGHHRSARHRSRRDPQQRYLSAIGCARACMRRNAATRSASRKAACSTQQAMCNHLRHATCGCARTRRVTPRRARRSHPLQALARTRTPCSHTRVGACFRYVLASTRLATMLARVQPSEYRKWLCESRARTGCTTGWLEIRMLSGEGARCMRKETHSALLSTLMCCLVARRSSGQGRVIRGQTPRPL